MSSRPFTRLIPFPGLTLVVLGLALPSATLLTLLKRGESQFSPQLYLGADLFRAGLVLLGLAAVVSSLLFRRDHASPLPGSRPQAVSRLEVRVVAALLLLTLGVRLHDLDSGLWLDEMLTYVQYARLPFGDIVTTFDSENQHFLYSLSAHASMLLFGENVWALRLPAVLFGVGSIWALYLLGREVSDPREALLASALLAFSYTHIWFSQNARGYTGLLFATLLSSWFLLRALRGGGPNWWLLYALTVALGVYAHMTMLFLLPAHFLLSLWTAVACRGQNRASVLQGIVFGFGVAALLIFQLHSLVLPSILTGMGREPSAVAAWKDPLWTALEMVRGLQISFAGGIVAVGALAVFALGALSYARSNPALLWLLVLPPMLGATVTVALGHHLWPRFFFFAIGFAALVLIRGCITAGQLIARIIPSPFATPQRLGTALSMGLILVSLASIPRAYGPKQDFQGAVDLLQANLQPGDNVGVTGLAIFPLVNYMNTGWKAVTAAGDLDSMRSPGQRTWLVSTFPPVLESTYPDVSAALSRDFLLVAHFEGTVNGGSVLLYRSDHSPSNTAVTGAPETK